MNFSSCLLIACIIHLKNNFHKFLNLVIICLNYVIIHSNYAVKLYYSNYVIIYLIHNTHVKTCGNIYLTKENLREILMGRATRVLTHRKERKLAN